MAKRQPAPEVDEAEVDYTAWADKPATDLQERFAAWITDKTEVDPSSFKTKQEAFEEGVRLAVALRMPFQRSPENQAVNGRAARAERAEVEEQVVKAAKPKATKKATAKPAPEVEDDSADAQLERPARKATKKAVRRPAAEVESDETEEARPVKKTGRKAARRGSVDAAF